QAWPERDRARLPRRRARPARTLPLVLPPLRARAAAAPEQPRRRALAQLPAEGCRVAARCRRGAADLRRGREVLAPRARRTRLGRPRGLAGRVPGVVRGRREDLERGARGTRRRALRTPGAGVRAPDGQARRPR